MATQEVILKRREQVKELYFNRNLTIYELHRAMKDWNSRTLDADIAAVRRELAQHLDVTDLKEILIKSIHGHEKVVRILSRHDFIPISVLSVQP